MADILEFPKPEPLWRDVLGEKLRAARTGRGETLTETAERAGISPQYLSEIERGQKEASSELLNAICGALDVPLADVLRLVSDRIDSRTGAQITQLPLRPRAAAA